VTTFPLHCCAVVVIKLKEFELSPIRLVGANRPSDAVFTQHESMPPLLRPTGETVVYTVERALEQMGLRVASAVTVHVHLG
jgi:hypothetical protein